jgi:hypothetical protein
MAPNVAVKLKADSAICGNCPFAGGQGCYVQIKAVCSVYRAYMKGSYSKMSPAGIGEVCARMIKSSRLAGLRAGSYGDPAAAPVSVWADLIGPIIAAGGKTTGYTHQWHEKYAPKNFSIDPAFKSLVMASAHGHHDARQANLAGWRAFTTFSSLQELKSAPSVAACPASDEGGNRRTCSTCGKTAACNGRKSMEDKRANIGIVVHGSFPVKLKAERATIKASTNGDFAHETP